MHASPLHIATFVLILLAGFIVDGAASARPRGGDGGVIYFHRPDSFSAAFKKPDVIVDGERVGSIGSGECHRLQLPAGYHKIVVRDQRSIISRLGLDISAARIELERGEELFITVRPLQDLKNFNDDAPAYDLMVSDEGPRC